MYSARTRGSPDRFARRSPAAHLSGGPDIETQQQSITCPASKFSIAAGEPSWTGWGVDPANSRFQPAKVAGLDKDKVARLKLKWAFGFAGQSVDHRRRGRASDRRRDTVANDGLQARSAARTGARSAGAGDRCMTSFRGATSARTPNPETT